MGWDYDEDLVKCGFCGRGVCCITCAEEAGWKTAPLPIVKGQKKPPRQVDICPQCQIKYHLSEKEVIKLNKQSEKLLKEGGIRNVRNKQ